MKNTFEIRGDKAIIFLPRKDGSVIETVIDVNDLNRVKEISGTWFAHWNIGTQSFYVVANITKNGKHGIERLHRWITNPLKREHVDHIDHDTLNNTRSNLRNVSSSVNAQNRKGLQSNNTSGYRGVCWDKSRNKWVAYVVVNQKNIFLGRFRTAKVANMAAIKGREKYHGQKQQEGA